MSNNLLITLLREIRKDSFPNSCNSGCKSAFKKLDKTHAKAPFWTASNTYSRNTQDNEHKELVKIL